jgi:hypothetical protein
VVNARETIRKTGANTLAPVSVSGNTGVELKPIDPENP